MPVPVSLGIPIETIAKPVLERTGPLHKTDGKEFSERVRDFVKDVNGAQKASDAKVTAVAEGRDNDLHGTMIAMEQANIQLRLMATVRNKVIEAYREVMRMGA